MSVRILHGDCRTVLPTLDAASVQCCVTSPPYYGLRNYGVDGQLGLEPTPDEYVAEMVAVFREVRRVLRDDGVLWLNIGDSYSGGGGFSPDAPSNRAGSKQTTQGSRTYKGRAPTYGCKPKDLIGIPWMLAFALRADGWYLRSDVVWSKPNPMPESVTDRPTKSHEYVFMLTKSARYFYDADAVAEPVTGGTHGGASKPSTLVGRNAATTHGGKLSSGLGMSWDTSTRNLRSVWTIATQPFSGTSLDFAGADYVDDRGTPRKLSPSCPVHGPRGPLQQETPAAASCDEQSGRPDIRTGTGAHRDQERPRAVAPTEDCKVPKSSDSQPTSIPCGTSENRTPGPSPDAVGNEPHSRSGDTLPGLFPATTDCGSLLGSPTASGNSNQSRKMARAHGSFEHDTLSEASASSTSHKEPLLSAKLLCERIAASKTEAARLSLHEKETALSMPTIHTSRTQSGKSSKQDKCCCPISQGSHFATMPPELAERCILAGSRPGDTILDPFSGAGTTALVADRLQRNAIGIELNPAYAAMGTDRVRDDAPLFADVAD